MNDCLHLFGRRSLRIAIGAGLVVAAAVGTFIQAAQASGTPPAVSLSASGHLTNGQTISVSVGPNSLFTPHAGVNILECADPGGTAANLPTDINTCDGNTIQGTTVLVADDGSFSESSYQVYSLPNSVLGEQANDQPICNQTNYCVLYVGQNQNDFTAPKVFSAPFLISSTSGATTPSTAPGSGSGGSSAASSTTAPIAGSAATEAATAATGAATDPGTSGTSASSTLADTGPPADLTWLAASGIGLLLTGVIGRRRALRGVR